MELRVGFCHIGDRALSAFILKYQLDLKIESKFLMEASSEHRFFNHNAAKHQVAATAECKKI